jgi:hypothetical protein
MAVPVATLLARSPAVSKVALTIIRPAICSLDKKNPAIDCGVFLYLRHTPLTRRRILD